MSKAFREVDSDQCVVATHESIPLNDVRRYRVADAAVTTFLQCDADDLSNVLRGQLHLFALRVHRKNREWLLECILELIEHRIDHLTYTVEVADSPEDDDRVPGLQGLATPCLMEEDESHSS